MTNAQQKSLERLIEGGIHVELNSEEWIPAYKEQLALDIENDMQKRMRDFKELNLYNILSFNQYQERAAETAIYPKDLGLYYTALGLAAEAGEVASEVSKLIRDDNGILTPERRNKLKGEVSDCYWFIAMITTELEFTMEEIAQYNLDKLADRKARNVLRGSGSDR